MTVRYYIMPMLTATVGGMPKRGPKYFFWLGNPSGLQVPVGAMDYGLIDACLACADVTQEQHEWLMSNPDVASPPADIDQNISDIAIPQVKAVLEQLRIPADWVTSAYTYRAILRMLAGLFQFAQAYHGQHNEALIDSTAQLDLRWNQIPLARRNRITATVTSLGYNLTGVLGTWLVRRVLFYLAGQWGTKTFLLGGVEL